MAINWRPSFGLRTGRALIPDLYPTRQQNFNISHKQNFNNFNIFITLILHLVNYLYIELFAYKLVIFPSSHLIYLSKNVHQKILAVAEISFIRG